MANETPTPRKRNWFWYWLLVPCFIGTLWPPFYASQQPQLWGFPFFYWYQFAWIPLSALFTGIVYLMTR